MLRKSPCERGKRQEKRRSKPKDSESRFALGPCVHAWEAHVKPTFLLILAPW